MRRLAVMRWNWTRGTFGQDFDFAGSTSRFLGKPSSQNAVESLSSPRNSSATAHSTRLPEPTTRKLANDWGKADPLLGFDDDEDPLLSSRRMKGKAKVSRESFPSASSNFDSPTWSQNAQQSFSPLDTPFKKPQIRTVEEIEAELMAGAGKQNLAASGTTGGARALTLAEVEAEMLAKAAQKQGAPPNLGDHLPHAAGNTIPPRLPAQSMGHSRMSSLQHISPFGGGSSQPLYPGDVQRIMTPDGMNAYDIARQQQQQYLRYRERQRQGGSPGIASIQLDQFGRPVVQGSPIQRPLDRTFYETEQAMVDGGHSRTSSGDQHRQSSFPHPLQMQQMQQLQQMGLSPAQFQMHLRQQQLQNQYQLQMLANAQIQRNMQAALERDSMRNNGADGKDRKREKDEVIRNAQATIEQHEQMEEKRRRKAQKIAETAKYNNLMTQSDKDFITRIQISQLVSEDPYIDDFYFHVLKGIKLQQAQAAGGPAGSNSPTKDSHEIGRRGRSQSNAANRRLTRRENAMAKMAQQVQRLVNEAKKKPRGTELSLEGALGKIALRTASQPRQLLQVSGGPSTSKEEKAPAAAAAPLQPQTEGQKPALTRRQVLVALEKLWDIASRETGEKLTEQEEKELNEWQLKYTELVQALWTDLRILDPLDTSNPHPFISLLSVSKGKRLLVRAVRHLSEEQTMAMLSLLVGNFQSLDVVRDAPILDITDPLIAPANRVAEVEAETDVFQSTIVPLVIGVVDRVTSLRLVTGLLHLMMQRNDIVRIATTRPGLAFLISFVSKAETLKQSQPPPEDSDIEQWQRTFDLLFRSLHSNFLALFPSCRAAANLPFGSSYYLTGAFQSHPIRPDIELEDEPVWQFLAACAVCADADQQQILVTEVKDKVLENVNAVNRGWAGTEEEKALKLNKWEVFMCPQQFRVPVNNLKIFLLYGYPPSSRLFPLMKT
ncbi:hypothetical protein BT69DRAFT_1318275, partial [Atractiella rhizophila]